MVGHAGHPPPLYYYYTGACPCHLGILHNQEPSSNKCSLMDAGTLEGCLHWGNCLKWFKKKKMIDVSSASPWAEPAQGLIRATTQPPPPPDPVTAHSHRIFSHYSGADRWASFCISAVHFLKSEKPIHLGQMQAKGEEEGEERAQAKLQNFFFSSPPLLLLAARLWTSLAGAVEAPPTPVSPSVTASPWRRRALDVARSQTVKYSFIGGTIW